MRKLVFLDLNYVSGVLDKFECWPSWSCNAVGPIFYELCQWRHNERDDVSNNRHHDCILNRFFRRRSKKTSKLRVTGLYEENSPVTGEFPAQRARNAENVFIWWRHHDPGLSSLVEHWLHQTVTLVSYLYRLIREQLCNSRQVWWESKERETKTETETSIRLWQGQVHKSITNVLCASLSLLDGQPMIPQNPL